MGGTQLFTLGSATIGRLIHPEAPPRLFAGLPTPSWEPRRPITPIRDTCKAIRVARGWCK